MFFFGKNLKLRHKLTLCLVISGILVNGTLWSRLPQVPMIELTPDGVNFSITHIVLAYGAFVKLMVLLIFRKF